MFVSDYVEFCIRYAREHSRMDVKEAAECASVAWDRQVVNPPGVDSYVYWMNDAIIILHQEHIIARLLKESGVRVRLDAL